MPGSYPVVMCLCHTCSHSACLLFCQDRHTHLHSQCAADLLTEKQQQQQQQQIVLFKFAADRWQKSSHIPQAERHAPGKKSTWRWLQQQLDCADCCTDFCVSAVAAHAQDCLSSKHAVECLVMTVRYAEDKMQLQRAKRKRSC